MSSDQPTRSRSAALIPQPRPTPGSGREISRREASAALLAVFGGVSLAGCDNPIPSDGKLPLAASAALSDSGEVAWVDTVDSHLRSIVGTSTLKIAMALGYWAKGDGGGGAFFWDTPTSAPQDNKGTIIVPYNQTLGCWRRIHSGPINVRWFGARGLEPGLRTGEPPTDLPAATEAFRETIRFAETANRSVLIPPGTYVLDGPIEITTPALSLSGINSGTTTVLISFSNPAQAAFAIKANAVKVSGLTIAPFSSAQAHAWSGFSFSGANACEIDGCAIISPYRGVFLAGGECDWLDLRVSIADFAFAGIDFWNDPIDGFDRAAAFSSNSRIRILGEIYGRPQAPKEETFGVRLHGSACAVEGGEIAFCRWPLQLGKGGGAGGNHTVRDVFVEAVTNGVWVTEGSHWFVNGTIGDVVPRIDAGSISYIGLDSRGNIAPEIQLRGAVSKVHSGLTPILAACRMRSPVTIGAGESNPLQFEVVEWDSHAVIAAPNGGDWVFRCPAAGVYRVSATLAVTAGGTGNVFLGVRRNGEVHKCVTQLVTGSTTHGVTLVAEVVCAEGNRLDILLSNYTPQTVTIDPGWAPQYVCIEKIAGS